MDLPSTTDFRAETARLQAAGKLPTNLTASQVRAIEASVRRYSQGASESLVQAACKEYRSVLESLVNPVQMPRQGASQTVTEGFNPATAREALTKFLEGKPFGAMASRIDFSVDAGTAIANGAGRHVRENLNEDVVNAYPALELDRMFDRDVPRGFMRGPKGELVPMPGDDWPSRWRAAGAECGDEDALRVLEETGRMVALKSSEIWAALGDGAGGYEDTIGNDYAPFAWKSGYRQTSVSREETEQLGLLEPGEKAEGAEIDLANLFSFGA
jgi:hypothetical protein